LEGLGEFRKVAQEITCFDIDYKQIFGFKIDQEMVWIGWRVIKVLDQFTMHIVSYFIIDDTELVEEQFILKVTVYLKQLIITDSIDSIIE
jgi:hypothetical protein